MELGLRSERLSPYAGLDPANLLSYRAPRDPLKAKIVFTVNGLSLSPSHYSDMTEIPKMDIKEQVIYLK